MIFNNKKQKIRLSNRLGWSVRRKMSPTTKFWISGGLILGLAFVLVLNTFKTPNPNPQVLGESTFEEQTESTPRLEFIDYTVEQGDTLFNIGQKFNVPWAAIAQLNDLGPKGGIKPGQLLKIPISK